ncbi:uncharacterized protein LOC132563973 [Ylistrum balloti]|uniref:uncharacterized protein LOC132563973 n=1 Tax=Ylistrum balloti TaxID=509963 RepID=UPI00290592B3|nr:uncharacterized protein LOC132563973 [Ylistrum balloti]
MSSSSAEFQSFKQQKAVNEETLRQKRQEGSKCLRYIGLVMLIASLGLLIASSLFMNYVHMSENIYLGSVPIGLFAAVLGFAGGLCEYCASRTMVESEGKGCSKSLVIANFLLSFVALGQCIIASAFAGSAFSTCSKDPGPPPDEDSFFTTDFRQCVSYRSEVKSSAIFLILFGIVVGVTSLASIVVYCMYKSPFGVYNQQLMLVQVERDTSAIQHILNLQEQYPDRNPCSAEELQQLQSYITELQTKLSEVASVPQRQGAGNAVNLMNIQAKITTLQQTLNTLIQMSNRPQQPAHPFQPEIGVSSYPGYPMGGPGQPMYYIQGQGQPVPYSQGQGQPVPYSQGQGQPVPYSQGQPVPYSQGQGQPVPYSQGQAVYYSHGGNVQTPLISNPNVGQGQHVHRPHDPKAGGELPPSYETVMGKDDDGCTEKNWV